MKTFVINENELWSLLVGAMSCKAYERNPPSLYIDSKISSIERYVDDYNQIKNTSFNNFYDVVTNEMNQYQEVK